VATYFGAGPELGSVRSLVEARTGGNRRRGDDRAILAAILYLTEAACSWW
jgi:hypothetical protein